MKTIPFFVSKYPLAILGLVGLAIGAHLVAFLSSSAVAQPQAPRSLTRVLLEVGGKPAGMFVSAELGSETEVILFTDGNSGATKKIPGRTKYSNIVLKRGFTPTDELWQWRKQIEEGVLDRRSGSVIILDVETHKEVSRYNFYEAWPTKWYVPDMDSDQSGMAVEKIEIAVERVEKP